MADLTTCLGKITLKNPVMTASGTFGYGAEYADFFPLDRLGAVVVKGISSFPWDGNPSPRIAEVTSGMLNSIGLQNPGVEKFLKDPNYLPALVAQNAVTIVNIWGRTVAEYADVAARLDSAADKIAALEINISCPNIKEGGISFGTNLASAAEVVSAVRKSARIPLITKLSPNVSDIKSFARCVVDAGTDMISLINTIPGMAIDINTMRPRIARVTGGLSGPAIKPIAVRMVYEVAQAVDVPIIGMGGISCAEDAIEFLLAGADAIAVGTAIFSDPEIPLKIISGINDYLDKNGYNSVSEIVGKVIVS